LVRAPPDPHRRRRHRPVPSCSHFASWNGTAPIDASSGQHAAPAVPRRELDFTDRPACHMRSDLRIYVVNMCATHGRFRILGDGHRPRTAGARLPFPRLTCAQAPLLRRSAARPTRPDRRQDNPAEDQDDGQRRHYGRDGRHRSKSAHEMTFLGRGTRVGAQVIEPSGSAANEIIRYSGSQVSRLPQLPRQGGPPIRPARCRSGYSA
jgi:hypothetical protein